MITRLISSIIGLLAFAGMILAGCLADNPIDTIIQRALVGLVGGMAVGYVAGILAQHIIDENFMNVVDADAQAEIAAGTVRPVGEATQIDGQADENVDETKVKTSLDSTDVGAENRQDKEFGQKSREQGSPLREQTLSVRAAKKMFG
jgi:hypothetical protein